MNDNKNDFTKDNVLEYINKSFKDEQLEFQKYKDRKIGFPIFDEYLRGLRPYLYVFAAEPSMGKTTFLTQISDNLAEKGETVLFFSLEQSKYEIVSKNISRMTFKLQENKEIPQTSVDIMQNIDSSPLIKRALDAYSKFSNNIYIIDTSKGISVDEIKEYVEEFIKNTGIKPILFIDYLQKIKTTNEKLSEKKQVDYNISELKNISKGKKIPIFVISSLNRASYDTKTELKGLKESGEIEYEADFVIALQLELSDVNEKEKKNAKFKAKQSLNRVMNLVVLKNRNGGANFTDKFIYYCAYNYFLESQNQEKSINKYGEF